MYHGWCDRGNTTGEVRSFDKRSQTTSPPPLIRVTIPRRSRDRLETYQGSQTIRVHSGLIGTRSVAYVAIILGGKQFWVSHRP